MVLYAVSSCRMQVGEGRPLTAAGFLYIIALAGERQSSRLAAARCRVTARSR